MKHAISIAALCAGILLLTLAAVTGEEITPSPSNTTTTDYEVKQGDTLWDISARFLDDPFQWPEIWGKNPFIADPHWIYPGQSLSVTRAGEPPRIVSITIQPSEKPEQATVTLEPMQSDNTLNISQRPKPRIEFGSDPRTEADQKPAAISAAATDATMGSRPRTASTDRVIRAFDTPRPVFTPEIFMRTGFIALRSELPPNRVVSIEEDGNATTFDYLVIDLGAGSLKEGDMLAVASIGDKVRHPDSGIDMGVVVRMKGYIRIESAGDTQSRCQVTQSFDPIHAGDIVLPARVMGGGMFDAYIEPDTGIKGTILAVNEPMLSIHTHDILYIDRGWRDGVRSGDRFTIFNRAEIATQRVPIGEIEAVNVMETQTAVVVVAVTESAIGIGDRVELTARCRRIE